MKGIFISIVLFFAASSIYPQSGWVQQISGIDQPISKIAFINENTGWCSASGGVMFSTRGFFLRTTNGGQNWTTILNSSIFYNSFHFVDQNTGWMAGGFANDIMQRSRNILKSTNGGVNWLNAYVDSARGSFNSVSFADYNNGFIVGTTYSKGLVFRTNNAGSNWVVDSLSFTNSFNDVYYMYINTGWVVGGSNGQICRTLDGGQNWVQQNTSSGITFFDVYFFDALTGWVVGSNGSIMKSADAGSTWYSQNIGTNITLRAIWFVNSQTGFITASSGAIYKSTNGGTNWFVDYQSPHPGNSLFFINSLTGWMAGGYGSPINIGSIYKTTTGGTLGLHLISTEIPKDFSLIQNYPNPFNPTTTIGFNIPNTGEGLVTTNLIVYDFLGQEVSRLVREEVSPGSYEVNWDGSNFSSGVYYYRLQTEKFTQTKKMILIK